MSAIWSHSMSETTTWIKIILDMQVGVYVSAFRYKMSHDIVITGKVHS